MPEVSRGEAMGARLEVAPGEVAAGTNAALKGKLLVQLSSPKFRVIGGV